MRGESVDELQGIGRPGLAMAGLFALGLLAATLAWPVPMMLWDHLDLVSIYEAWERDGLVASGIGDVHHGSHMHLAAYLLLLGTTWLSDGQTWLDCLVSWALLGLYATLLLRATPRALPAARPWWLLPALVGFVLYPGHLVNLQWGWQVAVFACLAGVAVVLVALARPAPGWRENLVALTAAVVAIMSFTTGLAIVPVAMALVVLQAKGGAIRRLALLAPWLLLVLAGVLVGSSAEAGVLRVQPGDAALYMLNYLGGGVARFATDIAPWLAFMALASAAAGGWVVRRDPRARLWGALVCFALGAAFLTAMGRAAVFGPEHALVSRYVSFSSVFWLGWLGLVALALPRMSQPGRRCLGILVALVLACAAVNAVHMAKKAREVARRADETAQMIRTQYPDVDEAILQDIYFGRSEDARARLDVLHRWRFAPFSPE